MGGIKKGTALWKLERRKMLQTPECPTVLVSATADQFTRP